MATKFKIGDKVVMTNVTTDEYNEYAQKQHYKILIGTVIAIDGRKRLISLPAIERSTWADVKSLGYAPAANVLFGNT